MDGILAKIMTVGKADTGFSKIVSEQEIVDLCVASLGIFVSQPVCVEISAPIYIAGDIHGQFGDLMRIFNTVGFPPTGCWLFLGDYIDRGKMSLETICLLFAIKHFFLLRGNHETALVNRIYGFYEEVTKRYGTPRLFNIFQDVFNVMPLSAVVAERILCMHGGLSHDLTQAPSLAVLRDIVRPLPVTLFSAPHYCGQFDNAAAVMHVSKDLRCSFKIMRPKFPGQVKKVQSDARDITCYKMVVA